MWAQHATFWTERGRNYPRTRRSPAADESIGRSATDQTIGTARCASTNRWLVKIWQHRRALFRGPVRQLLVDRPGRVFDWEEIRRCEPKVPSGGGSIGGFPWPRWAVMRETRRVCHLVTRKWPRSGSFVELLLLLIDSGEYCGWKKNAHNLDPCPIRRSNNWPHNLGFAEACSPQPRLIASFPDVSASCGRSATLFRFVVAQHLVRGQSHRIPSTSAGAKSLGSLKS